ncbi:MAG: trypsin-like peptidase domain-containing protein [Sandaracinaceae bacterium]
MRRGPLAPLVLSGLALIVSLVALGLTVARDREAPPPEAPSRAEPAAELALDPADVVARCLPSVVNISTRRVEPDPLAGNPFFDLLRPYLGGGGPEESQSLGSGVIVDPSGVILTNHHVVADATEIRVVLWDGRELEGRAVGSDPESDLAVLRVSPPDRTSLQLPALAYGDATAMRQGDRVLAIGNPFGVGLTVTMGIVSATGRAAMGITDYEDFIQTDAAINPGNSGGALVNLRGELIGINTAILSRTGGSHGIGFAIPSNMAEPVAAALLRDGRVTRGWLGVALQDLDPQLARRLGISGVTGAVVMDVDPSGPASGVDLRRGDVIVGLDAEPIRSGRQLRNLIATRGAGSEVRLSRERGGASAELTVRLAARPGVTGPPLRP